MESAQGQVQQMSYQATFPLLLNIADQPTYFMALKDAAGLVKMYAMVNVQQYQIVSTGGTVAECEQNYRQALANNNLIDGTQTEIGSGGSRITGTVAEIRSAVIDGTSVYYLRLEGGTDFYRLSADKAPLAILLNVGDTVTITYRDDGSGVALSGSTVERGEDPGRQTLPEQPEQDRSVPGSAESESTSGAA